MTAGDINQVTISGHIEQPPFISTDEDGHEVCEFLLSHASREHTEHGQWDLQHYKVAIYGQQARVFVDTYQPGEMIVLTGRLHCERYHTPYRAWKRVSRTHRNCRYDLTRHSWRTWITEPTATIIADTITTSNCAPNLSKTRALPA